MEFNIHINAVRGDDEYSIGVMGDDKDEIARAMRSALDILNDPDLGKTESGSTSDPKPEPEPEPEQPKKRGRGRPRKNSKPKPEPEPAETNSEQSPDEDESSDNFDPMSFEATRALLQRYINTNGKAAAKKILTEDFKVDRVREMDASQIPELHKKLEAGLPNDEDAGNDEI